MSTNPYSSPQPVDSTDATSTAPLPLAPLAQRVFLEWEKLRVVYVAVLGMVTIFVMVLAGRDRWQLIPIVGVGAVAANLLYFAGPALETYIRWLGYDKSWPRWAMFTLGTLLSIVLAFGVLAAALIPDQD